MDLRSLLGGFLVWVLYPIWLLAGAGDYLSHRMTHIEQTSGTRESWLHIAQFLTIAIILVCAVLFEITLGVFAIMALALIAHTALSFYDVSYTLGRRHISPIEQHVHGFMDVLPFIAVCLLGLMHWDRLAAPDLNSLMFRWKDDPLRTGATALLLGSYALFAGVPILEEWFRTHRAQSGVASYAGAQHHARAVHAPHR